MNIFFNSSEFCTVYQSLFDAFDQPYFASKEVPNFGSKKVADLDKLNEYYREVIRRRNRRRVPLAVDLTFEIVDYNTAKYKLLTSLKDVGLIEEMTQNLAISKGTLIYKLVNQIVDLNQKSKFALSFMHILKQLNFRQANLIAHLRNAFFHQETPPLKHLEESFRVLLAEIKTLFWDKNYYWLKFASIDDERVLEREAKRYRIDPLPKTEIYNVDEYPDSMLTEKELRLFLAHKEDIEANSSDVVAFLKTKGKKMHRKLFLYHLCLACLANIAEKIITHESKLYYSQMKGRIKWLIELAIQLTEIFFANANIHQRVLGDKLVDQQISKLIMYSEFVKELKHFTDALETKMQKIKNCQFDSIFTVVGKTQEDEAELEDKFTQSMYSNEVEEEGRPIKRLKIGVKLNKYMAEDGDERFKQLIVTKERVDNK